MGPAAEPGRKVRLSTAPAPDYELIARASGGHGERVDDSDQLPDAVSRALHVVRVERRSALLNVIATR